MNLLEKKDHIIKKISSLTDEQKQEVIQFFNKHNTLEGQINWNNWKNLTYDDFEKVMSKDSKTQKWSRVKNSGIKGLRKDKDYVDFGVVDGYRALAPLTYEASKIIASKYIKGVEGKWCTAYQKNDEHWISYTDDGVVFVYFVKDDDKVAFAYTPVNGKYEVFNKDEKKFVEEVTKPNKQVNWSELSINIDDFINNNKEKLASLSDKILDSEENRTYI